MAFCSDCTAYDPIDESTGKCKRRRAERHIIPNSGNDKEVINGWPIVNGNETQCVEHE